MTTSAYYQQQAMHQTAFEIAQAMEADQRSAHDQEMRDEAKYWSKVDAAEYESENN